MTRLAAAGNTVSASEKPPAEPGADGRSRGLTGVFGFRAGS